MQEVAKPLSSGGCPSTSAGKWSGSERSVNAEASAAAKLKAADHRWTQAATHALRGGGNARGGAREAE